jgi:anti-sigma factor RsiW
MSGHRDQITEADLHAYLDGELDPERTGEVERHLASDPADAKRLDSYRAQADMMRRLYGPLIERPVPARLAAAAAGIGGRRRSWRALTGALAASLLLFAAGAAGGWFARDWIDPRVGGTRSFVAEAVAAHKMFTAEIRHPVEVPASDYGHLVGWLSKRVGAELKAPKLEAAGYHLVGGRLLPGSGRAAAQFMYEDKGGRRITLYVRATDGTQSAFRLVSEGSVSALYWREDGLAWAIMGEMPEEALLQLAHTIYSALNS